MAFDKKLQPLAANAEEGNADVKIIDTKIVVMRKAISWAVLILGIAMDVLTKSEFVLSDPTTTPVVEYFQVLDKGR